MLRREKIIGTEAQTFMDNLAILYSKGKLRNHTNETFNLNLGKIVKEAGHNISDMLLDCSFQQESCSSKEFSIEVFPKHGLCYTFNSGKPGYPLHFITAGGRANALVLFLMAQPTQYYGPYSTGTTGFRVLVHDQNDWPDVENQGIDVSPGFLTTIPIKRHKIIRLPSPYKSNCGEKQLKLVPYYSRSACLFECLTRTVVDKCHCRVLGTDPSDKLNTTRYCGPTEIVLCAEVIQGDLLVNDTSCDCPLECEIVAYDVQVFSSTFPSKTFNTTASYKKFMLSSERRLEGAADNIEETIRANVAQVKIFYKTTTTEISEEKPAYDINDFGADIGGSMGLFLGCSLLTLCEFVDLFLMFCLSRFSFRRRVLRVSQ
ncbi:acid-sensing ion channel 1-like [Oculina patagonica]